MARDAHAWEREHLGGATFPKKQHNEQRQIDGKEPWLERCARVGEFGKTLKRGNALGAKAEPGIGTHLNEVFVELRFANMEDAEAYFAGLTQNRI